ncbi:hypothetical protein [Geofilum rubicundum]|uniref:Uncharacterized protein n=1 Tax=Geofilum rubicundum JCM 15548 TaxID=1236989 RepID=A0A0E9M373_9BACT|nr:hypothetical protein [Geofilum rubicundum]GAO31959.1 hypothetical protein JCM15548_14375 [Geofilum rubicundum JCM 15548]
MQAKEKLFVFVLLSLNFLQWFSIVESEYGLPQMIKYLFSVFALGAMIYYRWTNPSRPFETKTYDPVIVFFVVWSVYLLVEASFGFNDVFYIQRVLGQRYFYLPYLLPLILLYTRFDLAFFAYFLKTASVLIGVSIVIQFYVMGFSMGGGMYEPLHRIGLFDIGSGLVLLTVHFLSKKVSAYMIVFYFLISIFLFAHFGRRGLFLESVLLLIAMISIRLKSSLLVVRERMTLYFYIFLFGLFVFVLFEPVISSTFIFQRGFDESAIQASRGRVFDDFFDDFVGTGDWVFGRGLDGHVLRTIALDETEQLIENGFLTILLKGGLLYLVPMLLIMLKAAYLGFYKSNNDLAKGLAALVLLHIMSMMLFGLPDYSAHYVMVWVAVSGCLSAMVRQPDNHQVTLMMNA